MELFELDLKQLLEVKLLRLNKPKYNSISNSLSGNYNSIEDLAAINLLDSASQLENKIKEFNLLDEYSPSPENMFVNTVSFG